MPGGWGEGWGERGRGVAAFSKVENPAQRRQATTRHPSSAGQTLSVALPVSMWDQIAPVLIVAIRLVPVVVSHFPNH